SATARPLRNPVGRLAGREADPAELSVSHVPSPPARTIADRSLIAPPACSSAPRAASGRGDSSGAPAPPGAMAGVDGDGVGARVQLCPPVSDLSPSGRASGRSFRALEVAIETSPSPRDRRANAEIRVYTRII